MNSEDIMDQEVEQLKASNKQELLKLFTEAFRNYPFFSVFKFHPELERKLLKALLDYGVGIKGSWLYGIRRNGELVCASISVSSLTKPSILVLIRFIFSMMILFNISIPRILGRSKAKKLRASFKGLHKEKPKYKEQHLELMIIGTMPTHQRMGFGRKMLRFLYEKARNEGYKGIMLWTNRDAPAFSLYLKEGFKVEKEFTINEMTLCWMRLILGDSFYEGEVRK